MGDGGMGIGQRGNGHPGASGGGLLSCTLTVWAVFQFCVVKVRVDGVNTPFIPVTVSICSKVTFTAPVGAAASFVVKLWSAL